MEMRAGSRICAAERSRRSFAIITKELRTWYCDPERAGAGDKRVDPTRVWISDMQIHLLFRECREIANT